MSKFRFVNQKLGKRTSRVREQWRRRLEGARPAAPRIGQRRGS